MMNIKLWLICHVSSLMFVLTTPGLSKEYSSAIEATDIIELYTSEGCSSCPPADKWMRQLKVYPGLFKNFIPLAFHVDYWNQLGWKDRFSNKAYSDRQYQHQKEGNISQVYTPGFVVNSKEWRGLHNDKKQWPNSQKRVGKLKVDHNQTINQLSVSFSPISNIGDKELRINVAILGMNLSTEVKFGENKGSKLHHDFVVLSYTQQNLSLTNDGMQRWQIAMPEVPARGQKQNVLVVWISHRQSQQVIQATGGYL